MKVKYIPRRNTVERCGKCFVALHRKMKFKAPSKKGIRYKFWCMKCYQLKRKQDMENDELTKEDIKILTEEKLREEAEQRDMQEFELADIDNRGWVRSEPIED